ncbi:MAG: hypothetical protein JSW27_14965 [Phycisphaerales bacterium]|nr:MAG: hypothetical protein JSW27_14965 [Phycisphaerales bacterium]
MKIRHILLALLVLLLGCFVFFRVSVSLKLNRRITELRAQGYPLSLRELGESYRLADGTDNAADHYTTAFSHYVAWDSEAREGLPWVGQGKPPARTATMEPEIRERAERFLADNERTLSLLHEAVAIETSCYPIDFEEEIGAGVSWLGEVRKHSRLLSLEALVACERGDPNQALASVRAISALGTSLNTPILIHHLVSIAVQAQAYRTAEHVVNRVALTDEQLQALSVWLKSSDNDEGHRQALVGERCFGADAFSGSTKQLADHISGSGKLMTLVVVPRKLLGLHDRDMLSYLNLMQDYIDVADLPPGRRLAQAEALDQAWLGPKRPGLLTRILMPALLRISQLDIRRVADERVVRTALAIERYRLAEDVMPLALSDLVPTYLEAVPQDPFDGKDLKYRLRERGYVVYSIGDDGSDNGGTTRDERKRNAEGQTIWDVTFIVER